MRFLPKLFVGILLFIFQACASGQTVTVTQLMTINKESSREDIEKVLGTPIDRELSPTGEIAFYEYRYEVTGPRKKIMPESSAGVSQSVGWAISDPDQIFLRPLLLPLLIPIAYAHDEFSDSLVSETKRGSLSIVYDQSSRISSIHLSKNLVKELRQKRNLETRALKGSAEAQYELYTLLKDKNERLLWLCRSAHNGFPRSQIQMGRHYWYGIEPFTEDRALAIMWYNLAAKQGYDRGRIEVAERKGLLTENQTLRAEMLLKNWTANPKSCQSTFRQVMN